MKKPATIDAHINGLVRIVVNPWCCIHTEFVTLSPMWQFNIIKLPLKNKDWSRWAENNEQDQREEKQQDKEIFSMIDLIPSSPPHALLLDVVGRWLLISTFDVTVSTYEIQSAVRLIYRKHMSTSKIVIRTTHLRPQSVNLTCAKFANHGSEMARKKYRQTKIKKSKNSIFWIKKKKNPFWAMNQHASSWENAEQASLCSGCCYLSQRFGTANC